MTGWAQRLGDLATCEFVALFLMSLWQLRRYRSRGAVWAAASFGLLATVGVTGECLRLLSVTIAPLWLIKALLVAVFLVPYALYRFAANFVPVRGWARHLAEYLTAAAVLGTAMLPYLPYPGQPSPPGYLAYRILICAQWGLLFAFVAARMWHVGANQPKAARYRMRMLAIAAAGLDAPVILGAFSLSTIPSVQLASELSTVVMAVLFAMGLMLPAALRTWWRTGERNAMQVAIADLVRAESATDIAAGLLPHVAALTGAADIALLDADEIEVARYRAVQVPAQRRPQETVAKLAASPIEVQVGGSHRLVVRTDPYLPFFARAELQLLSGLAEFVGLAIDRCELRERERAAQARLAHQATHDPLTGLPNRALFADRLETALARAERKNASLAVMFLDLDRFKLVNDGIDHAAGDVVLNETARRLLITARAADTVARFGGDEFTVLAEVGDEAEALSLAHRFRAAISAPMMVGDRDLSIGVSVGVVMTQGDRDAASLIADADAAMYRAKEGGRDRVVLFGGHIREQAQQRLDIERELRHALANADITAAYQPIVDLRSGDLAGVEVLVRWDHPSFGRLNPEEFLDVAEDTGLILPLGERVLTVACAQATQWAATAGPDFRVWVNLSARQIAQPGCCDLVLRVLEETGLAPAMLGIEITESALMSPIELVTEQLRELRTHGVSIALDDFGTGFSSLGYLTRFRVDRLKIDRSFVAGIGTEPSTSLVSACLALGKSLGLTIVAEGVETPAQADWLAGAGCDEVQGFHFARPLNALQISNLIAHTNALARPMFDVAAAVSR